MPAPGAVCAFPACSKTNEPNAQGRYRFNSAGLCRACVTRQKRNGQVEPLIACDALDATAALHRRFLDNIRVHEGHILWTGYVDKNGYGRIGTTPNNPDYPNGYVLAHRYAFELWVGPIPTTADGASYHLDHPVECPKTCVDPDHLNVLTPSQHMTLTNSRPEEGRMVRFPDGELALPVARANGIPPGTFRNRLNMGWSVEDAATRPVRGR